MRGRRRGGPVGDATVEAADRRLAPAEVPEGLRLCLVSEGRHAELFGPEGQTAVWGDTGRDDPWTGPLVLLSTSEDDRLPVHDGAEETIVRGQPGYVAPAPLFQAVSSAEYGHVATWFERPGLVAELTVRRGSADDALRLADVVVFDGDVPMLPPGQLGPGTGTLSTGPFPSPLAIDPLSAWRLSWFDEDLERSLTVRGMTEVADAIDAPPAHRGVRGDGGGRAPGDRLRRLRPEGGSNGVAWEEPDGLVIQVSGLGLDREEITAVAESVADVGPPAGRSWRSPPKTASRPASLRVDRRPHRRPDALARQCEPVEKVRAALATP